ncbi:uncharacterized protein LOC62_04G006245 [Vanrija pseudolonga]|uniref:Uncharacterized protein n=1 Tax=Vanrija pseudolonga TaxID=143232 RepID=A0AAF0Y9X6_9TREE|nr:hypothetical protein LOC62_04G006245 [Vanrija pseudolonga]
MINWFFAIAPFAWLASVAAQTSNPSFLGCMSLFWWNVDPQYFDFPTQWWDENIPDDSPAGCQAS